jgi:hypothetical protein
MFGIENSQHGAASRRDVAAALGERAVAAAIRDGVLAQPFRGVVVDAGRALALTTRAAAALLACGPSAILSHNTAAALHGCGAAQTSDVHVTVPYTSWIRSKPGLIVHHSRLAEDDVVSCQGLHTVTLELAISELLCVERRWIALASLDQALAGRSERQQLDFIDAVDARLLARESRRGVRTAETLLCLASAGAESPQESRLRLMVVEAGFPIPVVQHPILTLSGELLYRLDLAWPELRIALEYDGYEAHEGRAARDAERDRRLAGRGWRVIRVRKQHLANPAGFLADLREVFAERQRAVGA